MKLKVICSFETSGDDFLETQPHIIGERSPRTCRHESSKLACSKLNSLPFTCLEETLHEDLLKALQVVFVIVTDLEKHAKCACSEL